jgi:hypothetical protein
MEIGYSTACNCSDIVKDHVVDNDRAARYKEDLHLLGRRSVDEEISDEHLMLFPAFVKAFVLKEYRQFMLSVDLIQDIDGNSGSSMLADLVLPEGHADLLQALVKAHPATRNLKGEGHRARTNLGSGTGEGKTGLPPSL